MAATRRLSELLQEQQEPFLVEAAKARRPRRGRGGSRGGGGGAEGEGGGCCPAAVCRRLLRLCNHGFKKRRSGGTGGAGGVSGLRSVLSKVLCSRAMRRVLQCEGLGGLCFSGAGSGGDREFRRLRRSIGDSGECDPRAMELGGGINGDEEDERRRWKADMELDSSRQLSPVSVLELHSDDEESPVHSRWEDEKLSTSGSSPPSEAFLGPTSPCFTYNLHDKFCEMEVDESDEEMVRNGKSIEEQISSWEKIAGDISRIPMMMELDLSRSMPQWRELKNEAREIGARIETLIFEDIRRETVCDMLASHCTLATATSC
ncbi:uncharacterized protein LOC133914199 [Phragmites australis]|uniref:uncharacterized protein LOC133914199 n=1 Tax=Phragmites australis TaxID=29695 RepID=UPI002D76A53A|nr:uncharacterized protein LOC133914199 [Phragmites australis]